MRPEAPASQATKVGAALGHMTRLSEAASCGLKTRGLGPPVWQEGVSGGQQWDVCPTRLPPMVGVQLSHLWESGITQARAWFHPSQGLAQNRRK